MELDVRGTPLWQIQEYLGRMGLTECADGSFRDSMVTVTLEASVHMAFGTAVPRVVLRFAGLPGSIQPLEARLRLWCTRVGG